MNFGQWEGLSWKEIDARFPEDARAWSQSFPHHRPPGGESFSEFRERVITEVNLLADTTESGALLVTHAGVIRAVVAWVLGIADHHILRIGVEYGSATIIEKAGKHWMVVALNAGPAAFGRPVGRNEDGL
jgi:broad specificity phosphatase PhoE